MLKLKNINQKLAYFNLKIDNLEIKSGEYFTIVGHSGSGKTTLLELIAGFRKLHHGKIYLNDNDITNKPINEREVVFCSGNYLYPHLTVKENISLSIRKKNKREQNEIINNIANILKVSHLLNRYPKNLSGGEKQRVSLAMALVSNPKVILLDEPLCSVDRLMHGELIEELKNIHESNNITFIHVTHDFVEALSLSDRLAIIKNGKIEQFGEINNIIKKPKNRFVAEFVGYTNFLKGYIKDNFFHGDISFKVPFDTDTKYNITVAIRPEDVIIVGSNGCKYKSGTLLNGKIKNIYPLGLSTTRIILDIDGVVLICETLRSKALRLNLKKGDEIAINISNCAIIDN